MRPYEKLETWRKAMDLVVEIYRVTKQWPQDEMLGLVTEVRKAAIAIPSKIAHGRSRFTNEEFREALSWACGSLAELETQLMVAKELGYLPAADLVHFMEKTEKLEILLNDMVRALEHNSRN